MVRRQFWFTTKLFNWRLYYSSRQQDDVRVETSLWLHFTMTNTLLSVCGLVAYISNVSDRLPSTSHCIAAITGAQTALQTPLGGAPVQLGAVLQEGGARGLAGGLSGLYVSLPEAEQRLQQRDKDGHRQTAEEDYKHSANIDDVQGRCLAEVLHDPPRTLHGALLLAPPLVIEHLGDRTYSLEYVLRLT